MKGRKEHSKAEERREDHKEEMKREHKAEGGRMKADMPKRKVGGAVHGKAPMHRLDKKARGGRMSPTSPLSGASVKELGFAHGDIPAVDDGGKGKERD